MSRSISNRLPNGREPFLAFVADDPTLDVVQSVANELGWRADACKKGGLRAAVQALSVAASPAMMMIDLSEASDPLNDIESLAEVCEPGTIVIAVGRVNDVTLYRDLVVRGIHDYLVKPLSAAQLHDALARARQTTSMPRDKGGEVKTSHLSAAVVGTRGGVGASTLATSIAFLMSSEHNRSTALLDLDVHFGTAALALDLEPGRALADAIADPARIDGIFIERAMIRASEKLAILSAEAPLSAGLMTDGSAFLRLEQEFRQAFEATIIDLPRSIMINFPQLLAEMNTIVVATDLTLASARDAIRIISWLKGNAPKTAIIVVANKVQLGSAEITQTDFSAAIERSIDYTVPYDHKAAIQAARLGQTLVEANRQSKIVAPITDLVRKIRNSELGSGEAHERAVKPNSLIGKLDWKALLAKKPILAAGQSARPAA